MQAIYLLNMSTSCLDQRSFSFGVHVKVSISVSPHISVKHFTFPRSYLLHVLIRNIKYLLYGLPSFCSHYNCISSSFLPSSSHSRRLTGPPHLSLDVLPSVQTCPHPDAALMCSVGSLRFIAGLTTVLKIIPLVITGAFWSHSILVIFLHRCHPVIVLFLTSLSKSPFHYPELSNQSSRIPTHPAHPYRVVSMMVFLPLTCLRTSSLSCFCLYPARTSLQLNI